MYTEAINKMSVSAVADCIPSLWLTLTRCKQQHYNSMAHFYLAVALTSNSDLPAGFAGVHVKLDRNTKRCVYYSAEELIENYDGRRTLGILLFHSIMILDVI